MFWCMFLFSFLTFQLSVAMHLPAIQAEIIFSFNYSHPKEVDKVFKVKKNINQTRKGPLKTLLNKIGLGKKKYPKCICFGVKTFSFLCIHSFILCEETTLEAGDTEMECTHLMFIFRKRKQMRTPKIIV